MKALSQFAVWFLLFAVRPLAAHDFEDLDSLTADTRDYSYRLTIPKDGLARSLWNPQEEVPLSPLRAIALSKGALAKLAKQGEDWKLESITLQAGRVYFAQSLKAYYRVTMTLWNKETQWELPFIVLMNGDVIAPEMSRK